MDTLIPDPLMMEDALRELRAMVDAQSEDAVLWLDMRPSVAHMQRALRDLHALIERSTRWVTP